MGDAFTDAASSSMIEPVVKKSIKELMDDFCREVVMAKLREFDGNKSHVSRELKVNRRTLYRWLDEWEQKGLIDVELRKW